MPFWNFFISKITQKQKDILRIYVAINKLLCVLFSPSGAQCSFKEKMETNHQQPRPINYNSPPPVGIEKIYIHWHHIQRRTAIHSPPPPLRAKASRRTFLSRISNIFAPTVEGRSPQTEVHPRSLKYFKYPQIKFWKIKSHDLCYVVPSRTPSVSVNC